MNAVASAILRKQPEQIENFLLTTCGELYMIVRGSGLQLKVGHVDHELSWIALRRYEICWYQINVNAGIPEVLIRIRIYHQDDLGLLEQARYDPVLPVR